MSCGRVTSGLQALQSSDATQITPPYHCMLACAAPAGIAHLSALTQLRHLSLAEAFEGATHYGLQLALQPLAALKALNLSRCNFATQYCMSGLAPLTSLTMLALAGVPAIGGDTRSCSASSSFLVLTAFLLLSCHFASLGRF